MKKIFLKVLLLFVLCAIFLSALNFMYMKTNFFKSENGLQNFFNVPDNLEIVNLGSSHGYNAFFYSVLPELHGRNFSLPAQHFAYDYTILKLYKTHIKKGAIVLLPVSYFSFHYALNTRPDIRPRYYRILPNSAIPNASITEDFRYSIFPILSSSGNIIKIFNDYPAANSNSLDTNSNENTLDVSGIEDQVFRTYRNWSENMTDMKHDTSIVAENTATLIKMIELCQTEGFIPVLITTPLTRPLNERYTFFCKSDFFPMIEQVRAKTGNPLYLDYSHDARFVDDFSLFHDCNHLNKTGGGFFTRIVYDDLRKQSLINK